MKVLLVDDAGCEREYAEGAPGKVEGAGWTLHLGDCLDPVAGLAALADKSIDHVITDPPYSAHVHASVRRGDLARAARGLVSGDGKFHASATISRSVDLGFEPLEDETRTSVAVQASRVARRWTLAFSDTESSHMWRSALAESGLTYVRTCFWHKLNGAPQFTGDRPAVALEAITLCHPLGAKRWNGGGKQGIYSCAIVLNRGDGENRVHTTQKPEALMEALIRDFTDPGDTILDPFAGSGTTGVAAIRLGRRFIGWERDPEYFSLAVKRLQAAREQLTFPGAA